MALQMTCPYCKHEFPYDNGKIDMQISRLGQRINEIDAELAMIKAMSFTERKKRERARQLLVIELTEARVKISKLKSVRGSYSLYNEVCGNAKKRGTRKENKA